MKKSFGILLFCFVIFNTSAQFRKLMLRPRHGQIIGQWQATNQPLRAWIDGNKMFVIQGEMDNFVVRGANMLTRPDVVSNYKNFYQNFTEITGKNGLEMPQSFVIPKFCIMRNSSDGTPTILCGDKAIITPPVAETPPVVKKPTLPQAPTTNESLPNTLPASTIRRGKGIDLKSSGYPKINDGYSYLRADGSVREVVSRLKIENGKLSDEQWNRPFLNDNAYEKGFYIGLGSKSNTAALQNLDVSAMEGFDLSVIEVYTEKSKFWNGKNWIQHYITVPGKRMATDTLNNAIYFWNPAQYISESILPDFYDSFPEFSLPKGKIVKFSYLSGTDFSGEKATKRGVSFVHNVANLAIKSWMDYDYWLLNAGCPQAYSVPQETVNKWLDGVDANVLRKNFSEVVRANLNIGYLSLNFEPVGAWNGSRSMSKIGYVLQEHKAQKATGELAIWNVNPLKLSRPMFEGDKNSQGFTNILKWSGSGYEAYNRAFPTMYTNNVWNNVRDVVTVSQVGNYCTDLRNTSMIYHLMSEGLASKKIEPTKKTVANIWHDVEIMQWQLGEQNFRTSSGEVYKVYIKPTVPPDLMQSWGVWSMWLDGLDMWSDPNTKVDNPDLWGSKGVELTGERNKGNKYGDGISSHANQSHKNIDWLMAGVWAMSMNKDILEANTPIEYPDVILPDGRTVTGDNKLPTEAFVRGLPLVLKKRDDDSKDVLYTAYWGHNAANKAIKIMVDGNEIIIKGQYTSVVRVKN
jgi:hypothetical protein